MRNQRPFSGTILSTPSGERDGRRMKEKVKSGISARVRKQTKRARRCWGSVERIAERGLEGRTARERIDVPRIAVDLGVEKRKGARRRENEEPCLWFVRQCKPAFSYHCIVPIVPATRAEGLLVIIRESGGVEKRSGRDGTGFIRLS